MRSRVVVEAPASSANLGCGYDIFAMGLARPRDRLTLQPTESDIVVRVRGSPTVPQAPEDNVVGAVASAMMKEHDVKAGISMALTKGVPVGAGLGSSAASSVAAAVGVDRLFGLRLPRRELVRYAGVGEKLASGTAHYDNAAASLAGGFVIVRADLDFARIEAPASMALCLVTPQVKLPREKTKFARSLVPKSVPTLRAVAVARAASRMVHGFATGDLDEIGGAMNESLVDGPRSVMIPRFEYVRKQAASNGAAGVCISGAGPSLLAVCERRSGNRVMRAMVRAFSRGGVKSTGFVTQAGRGCVVIEG